MPGPEFEGLAKGTPGAGTEAPYYNWVDQYDTSGLGKDTPIATGNESDSLSALVNGKWVVMRVPYPIGYFAKGMDGRIDDPATGWKGKGLWSTFSDRAPTQIERGKGQMSKVVHFQLRPESAREIRTSPSPPLGRGSGSGGGAGHHPSTSASPRITVG